MKVTEHVEHLLRQGRKPGEFIELGFPKSVVTRVRRQLREQKATSQKEEAARAPQTDIFYHYKTALLKAIALDRATRHEKK